MSMLKETSQGNEDLKMTAYCFEKYKLDALFVIGGFEALTAVTNLESVSGC